MRGRDHRIAVLLALILAFAGTAGTALHAHEIDEADAANDCASCVLGSSPVDQIAHVGTVVPPELAPAIVATPTDVATTDRTYVVRAPRGPPAA